MWARSLSFVNIYIYTQLLFGDNDLNNHNDYCSCNVIAKLQIYKNKEQLQNVLVQLLVT